MFCCPVSTGTFLLHAFGNIFQKVGEKLGKKLNNCASGEKYKFCPIAVPFAGGERVELC